MSIYLPLVNLLTISQFSKHSVNFQTVGKPNNCSGLVAARRSIPFSFRSVPLSFRSLFVLFFLCSFDVCVCVWWCSVDTKRAEVYNTPTPTPIDPDPIPKARPRRVRPDCYAILNSCHCELDHAPFRNVSCSDLVQGNDRPNASMRSQSIRIDSGLSIPQIGSARNHALYFDLLPFILIL